MKTFLRYSFIALIPFILLIPQGCYIGRALMYQTAGIYDYKIFHNRTIKASENPLKIEHSHFYNRLELSSTYLTEFSKYKTTAFLVIKNDSLLYEKYWLDGGPEVISNSFSMAKSVTSLLIGIAIRKEK
jgi:hypothetical protein